MTVHLARQLFVVVVGLPLLAACVVLPMPPFDLTYRTNVGEEVPAFIVPAKTSKAEMLRTLGQPDYVREDESEFIYLVLRTTGGLWMTAGYNESLIAKVRFRALFVTFDQHGIVEGSTLETGLCAEEPHKALCGSRITVLNLVRGMDVSIAGWCRPNSHDTGCPDGAGPPDPPGFTARVANDRCTAASCIDESTAACPCAQDFVAAFAIYDDRPGTPTEPSWPICSEPRGAVRENGVYQIVRKNDLDAFRDARFVTSIYLFANSGRTLWGTDWAQCSASVDATNWSHGFEVLYKSEFRSGLSDRELSACATLIRAIANCPE